MTFACKSCGKVPIYRGAFSALWLTHPKLTFAVFHCRDQSGTTATVRLSWRYTGLLVIIVAPLTIMLREAVSVAPRPVIRALLIDLSGTVHVATQPTPRSPEAIQRLRDSSIPFRFCSNTSKESTAILCDKLARMGIETRDNEVWTSIGAVNSLLRAKGVQRCVLQMHHPLEWT